MANEKLEKATNISTDTNLQPQPDRVKAGNYSLFSLSTLNGTIYEEVKKELRFPYSSKVYKQMLLDSSVATPYQLVELMVSRPEWKVAAPKDAPEEEKTRAKMLNFNRVSMERPWAEYIIEMISYVIYGHWEGEKIFKKMDTPYGSFKGISDIQTISQDTVEKWIWDTDTKKLLGLRQNLSYIQHDGRTRGNGAYTDIPRIKFLHIRNSAKRNNPEGRSVLNSCYVDWKYKSVIEELQAIGVSKDLSGIPMLGIDVEILNKANEDPSGWQAQLVAEMKASAQALHTGDLSCGITPISYNDQGKELFTFKLQGIEGGGGKQYKTSEIIKYHSDKILMTFFADVLSLGSEGGGSFALSDNKITLLNLAIESHLKNIKRVLDHDLIRHLYAYNGWEYNPETACRFEYGDIDDGDIAHIAGAIQKIFAVGAVRPSKEFEDYTLGLFGLEPYNGETEFIETQNTSRSGDGMEESLPNGTGSSTAAGGNRSTANASKDTV